ncbi:THUMP-like domain-containing protein [Hwangdonia lutea]|uniref:RsmD family RNA methyltransferase n=1 Tax=Hwangdonia lutea TaxID=3075823 RepID=A0AA97HR71_9FLAO|nr:RsmD family RNA methyltransferase [Hwangdonia sp. SCSIO 19198]WOD43513.1 RsmD family RNA methyltransferase [Hwangdonia sp. SCSIO 19198]
MNPSILNTEIQEFINENLQADVSKLLLKGTAFDAVETKDIIEQIEAKKRSEKKLPTWFNTTNIYYPNKLNIEQTSSEITANYKSKLIKGESIIDLTGGFGVDCYYFSKHFKTVVLCEINDQLSEIVKHNYTQLHARNISTQNVNGITYLKTSKKTFDWIYIDPSRRHDSKGKVFFLNDCLPNIPEHLDLLFRHSKNILIKTSPLLDISVGINELRLVKTIHVVAVNNEVKELLWILERGYSEAISIETVNIKKDKNAHFSFLLEEEKHTPSNYHKPLTYLYEPNAAILKSGGFHSISHQLKLFKLHQHSHLYTSQQLVDFPGRCFKIEKLLPFNKKALKKEAIKKANITTRNFPETVQQIRKKFSIKDGGNLYLFFTTDIDGNKIVIISTKAN